MIKKIIVIVIILAGQSFAQLNVWRWQNPLPVGDFLHAVQMFSLTNTYACGENGVFMRTTDGGQTWDVQTNILKFNGTFTSLSFSTEKYGMLAGAMQNYIGIDNDSGMVMKTTDGGKSWKILPTNMPSKINGIVVIDTNVAIFITKSGLIMKTTDGGASWHAVPTEGYPELLSIRMMRPDFITVTGNGGLILRSHDEFSSTPTRIDLVLDSIRIANNFYTSNFTDSNAGTILADNGLIYRTTNGGISWKKENIIDSSQITATLNGIDGKDPNILSIAGDFGTLLFTTDGGITWAQSIIGTIGHVKGISFFDKENATAVGRDGMILRTTNGGKDWYFLPQIPQVTLLISIAFPKGDTSLGIAVGYDGVIMRTTNGGREWKVIPNGWSHVLRSVTFLDPSTVIAVGDYGAILKSIDAGQTWVKQQQYTGNTLYSVSFASPKEGIAVGDLGTVLKTNTGGDVWTTEILAIKDTEFFNSVSYVDEQHAFIFGLHRFFSSSDRGVSWIQFFEDDGDAYLGASFTDTLHGAILRYSDNGPGPQNKWFFAEFTSDGGKTWLTHRTLNNTILNGIQSVDRLHATVVGNNGTIYHTSDGGITLQQQQSNTPNNLYGVCFGTVKAGTAVGLRGNIMRITTDETPASSVKDESSESLGIQIYPNPATELITIDYTLPFSGMMKIEIYSATGALISSSPEEYKAEGNYSINFNTHGLASGTYLCRITLGNAQSKRTIVISK